MTIKILKNDNKNIACRSNVRPGDNSLTSNIRVDLDAMPAVVTSRQNSFKDDDTVSTTPSTLHNDNKF